MADYTQIIDSDDPFVVSVFSNGDPINTSLTTNTVVDIGTLSLSSLVNPSNVSTNTTGEITLTVGALCAAGTYNVVITLFDATSTNGTIVVHPKLNSNLKLTCKP